MATDSLPQTAPPRPMARVGVLFALLLIALVPLLPAIVTPNYPANHESFRYEQLTALFASAISHGFLYPRWLPDLAGGHGYPTFVFYQPLVFWVSAAVSALGIGPSKWMYVADYVFFFLGAAGTYRLAQLYIDRVSSLATSLLFLLTPYLFVNLYIRGDHSELASMLLGTWVLWAMILTKRRFDAGQRFWLVAIIGAIALAMIIMAHPATALIATPTFGFICIAQVFATRSEDRKRWATVSCAIAALTLAISSPYWFCVWQCGPFVHLEKISAGYFQPHFHNVPVSRLLSGHWSFGVSHGGEFLESMATPLGLVQLLMAIAGLIAGWRNPWVRAVGLAYLGMLFLILPLSRGFWAIEHNPLRAIQFPWRLLAVTASVQVFFVVALLERVRHRWLPIVLILAAAGWQWQMFRTAPVPNRLGDSQAFLTWKQADDILRQNIADLPGRDQTFAGVNEFDPKWMLVRPDPRGDKPLITALNPVEYLPGHSEHCIAARIVAEKETGVRLNQFYFPGWHVEVNGVVITDEELRAAATEDGRMLIPVPAGTSELRAWYAGPPLATFRLTSAIVIAIGSIFVLRRNQRVSHRGNENQSTPTESFSP